jgi:hypothetical protein
MRPLWGFFASAMESLVVAPHSGARLWYDDRDIPFLREDVMDQAQIMSTNAQTVRTFIDAGFDPDASLAAVGATDLSRLKGTHSGLYSVQLQPPMTTNPAVPPQRETLTIGEIQHRVDDGWTVLELERAA